jgi:hypothetical protein
MLVIPRIHCTYDYYEIIPIDKEDLSQTRRNLCTTRPDSGRVDTASVAYAQLEVAGQTLRRKT